jgi:hypothetical protein
METPQPIDVSKLAHILKASKQIMNKVENHDYSTGHIDGRALNEDGVQQMYNEGYTAPASQQGFDNYAEDQIKNSKLPDVIKKAMIENPIPKLSGFNHTFNAEDVADLIEKPLGVPQTKRTPPKQQQQSQRINEQTYSNQNSEIISVTKEQLKEMVNDLVNEKLIEFFMKANTQRITEDAVKKTLTALVKEGKIVAKKKTI